ncbi:MAG: substrate-binding domain-containing protein [Bacillota bacterium]
MKLVIRLAAAFMVLLLTLSASGCLSTKLIDEESKKRIKVIVKNKNTDFWKVVRMGTEAAGTEFGVDVDFDGPTDEGDIEAQISIIERTVIEKYDALVLAACDYNEIVPAAEKAIDAGIPVVVIDSALNSKKIKCFIGTDNVDAGRKAGEKLIEILGNKCKIAIMSFVKGTGSSVSREEGLYSVLKENPGIEVISKEYCMSDEALAESLAMKILEENGSIDAFVCLNAQGTIGVARAIKSMDLGGKVKIIGFDSTPEEISFIEKGIIQATVVQNPFGMGYLGIKIAVGVLNGKEVEEYVNTGSTVIDKDNMFLPENQKLVFPFTN